MTALPEPYAGALTGPEADYIAASRAENTRRGYRSDWADFTAWCDSCGRDPLPANPETINQYVLALLAAGAKLGTIERRFSSIGHAHRLAGIRESPAEDPRVRLMWEGVRRTHHDAPDKAPPLMPPVLWDVLDALPATPRGHRDAALLLVSFVGALRRSETAAARIEHLDDHDRGRVLTIPSSKGDQHGEGQMVVLPRFGRPERCPVTALDRWLAHLETDTGPLFRRIHRSGSIQPGDRQLTTQAVNDIVQAACAKALGPDHGYSAHSLRSGFVTYVAGRGASEREIATQTRHRSLTTVAGYIRHETAWIDNAATILDF